MLIKCANYICFHWCLSRYRDVKCSSACYTSRLVFGLHEVQLSAFIIVLKGKKKKTLNENKQGYDTEGACVHIGV